MPIRFKCPHCKKPLQVKDHLAGKKAACPSCKKPLIIPASAAPVAAQSSAPAVPAPPAPEPPPIDAEAEAAAALADVLANGKHAEAPAETIDFKCEFCETELHVPRSEAGKRMQCTNPDCRSLIKVPAPKDGQPRALPTVAQLKQQVEKIDEAAWGTQTDKARVHTESVREAGALDEPAAPPLRPRDRIRRVALVLGIATGVVVLVIVGNHVRMVRNEKNFIADVMKHLDPPKGADPQDMIKEPVARAAAYRAIAEYKLHDRKEAKEVLRALQQALASMQSDASVEADLMRGELALSIADLGGTEQEEIAKEKIGWKALRDELIRALEAIRAPEARLIALRALTTRLLDRSQPELADALALSLSNAEAGRKPPATSQLVVLLLLKDQPVDNHVKPPNLSKEVPEPLARVAFAEYHARKGDLDEALKLASFTGVPQHRVEACIGVAQVILESKTGTTAQAAPFVEQALKAADPKRVSPWLLLQTIRYAARVQGSAALADQKVVDRLPARFQPRGYLELVLAEADAATTAVGPSRLEDIVKANPDSPSLDLGWEALARQNARLGKADTEVEARDEANRRFRPMVYIGRGLAGMK